MLDEKVKVETSGVDDGENEMAIDESEKDGEYCEKEASEQRTEVGSEQFDANEVRDASESVEVKVENDVTKNSNRGESDEQLKQNENDAKCGEVKVKTEKNELKDEPLTNGTADRGPVSITVTSNMYGDDEEDEEMDNMIEARDDREGCRSLVCDSNGIIVAEMVYRCMICANVSDSIAEAQKHYQIKHILNEYSLPSQNCNSNTSTPKYNFFANDESDFEDPYPHPPTVTYNVPSSLKQLQQQANPTPNSLLLRNQRSHFNSALGKEKNIAVNGGQGSSRGGYVTCAVCNITKFYASVQRRYGQFTCMGCAKFFGRFLMKPRRYFCPNLGSCPLDTSPRCKACLLLACINTYTIDQERMKIVNANRPLRKSGPSGGTSGTTSITIGQQSESLPVVNNVHDKAETSKVKSASITVTSNSTIVNSSSEANLTTVNTYSSNYEDEDTPSDSYQQESGRNDHHPQLDSPSSNNDFSLSTCGGRKGAGCKSCPGCLSEDCGKCHYCLDKPKYGGPNTLKKKCVTKRCMMQEMPNKRVYSSSNSSFVANFSKKMRNIRK